MPETVPDVRLPNAGPGPDPLALSDLAGKDAVDAIVVLLQRDHYCIQCRQQVQAVDRRYEEFTLRNAWVVTVLPEERETAQRWVDTYDLSLPVLADPDHEAAEALGQTVRFGPLGQLSDLLARMPKAALVDAREERLELAWAHDGGTPGDRPDVDTVLERVDALLGEPDLPAEAELG
jgi:peroxiredoxin Q/BCP